MTFSYPSSLSVSPTMQIKHSSQKRVIEGLNTSSTCKEIFLVWWVCSIPWKLPIAESRCQYQEQVGHITPSLCRNYGFSCNLLAVPLLLHTRSSALLAWRLLLAEGWFPTADQATFNSLNAISSSSAVSKVLSVHCKIGGESCHQVTAWRLGNLGSCRLWKGRSGFPWHPAHLGQVV